MKFILSIIITFLFSSNIYCQNGFEHYKDLINIEDDITLETSNIDEMKKVDLSNFWFENKSERSFGFIGSNYRRLRIKYLSVIKNSDVPTQYIIYGKSKVSENVCEFQGHIEIKESYYMKSLEFADKKTGIIAGKYSFYENPTKKHTGVFRGRFVTYWYKDSLGVFKYNNLWDVADSYNNNQFAGTWTGYGKSTSIIANWGDSRIPFSGDLDVGTGEFGINNKYEANGWETFNKAWLGGYNNEETKKAREEENKKWWIPNK